MIRLRWLQTDQHGEGPIGQGKIAGSLRGVCHKEQTIAVIWLSGQQLFAGIEGLLKTGCLIVKLRLLKKVTDVLTQESVSELWDSNIKDSPASYRRAICESPSVPA